MGLHELAGQTSVVAPLLTKHFLSLDVVLQEHHPFGYDEHDAVVLGPQSSWKRILFILHQILSHDFFIFEGSPFTFHLYEVPFMKLLRRKFIIRFHGCDVRYREGGLQLGIAVCETCDQQCEPWKPSRTARLVKEAAACIVTTPDLLGFLPSAVFIPQAVNVPETWAERPDQYARSLRLRVIHAPSIRSRKGTDVVLQVLEKLSKTLPIDIVLLEHVPHSTVLSELDTADLVIDQLRVGWYGVLACEAMARGVPVIAYLRPEWVAKYQPDCPIVCADDASLEETVRALLTDSQRMKRIATQSRMFAKAVHSPEAVAEGILSVCRRAL
jgi:glycosyltransferase involved in cell wall biosynthesis